MLLKIFNKLLHYLLTVLIIGYIVFEELVWERFAQPITRFISRLKLLQKLNVFLQTVDSKIILVLFITLFIIVELQGLYAATLFVQGKIILGVLVYAGKVPITAFTFWLFRNVKSKLMEFIWFERAYIYVTMLVNKITHSQTYLGIKKKAVSLKLYFKQKMSKSKGSLKVEAEALYIKLRPLRESDDE